MTIIRRAVLLYEKKFGTSSRAFHSVFVYDTEEPYAVTVEITEQDGEVITWVFARDLLVEGLEGDGGIGDVRCWAMDGYLHIRLSSPDGSSHLLTSQCVVEHFLEETDRLVPLGKEVIELDQELERWLL